MVRSFSSVVVVALTAIATSNNNNNNGAYAQSGCATGSFSFGFGIENLSSLDSIKGLLANDPKLAGYRLEVNFETSPYPTTLEISGTSSYDPSEFTKVNIDLKESSNSVTFEVSGTNAIQNAAYKTSAAAPMCAFAAAGIAATGGNVDRRTGAGLAALGFLSYFAEPAAAECADKFVKVTVTLPEGKGALYQPELSSPTIGQVFNIIAGPSDAERFQFLTANAASMNNAQIVPLDRPELLPKRRTRTAAQGCAEIVNGFLCVDLSRNIRCVNGVVAVNVVNPFSANNLIKACVGGFCGGGVKFNACVGTAQQAIDGSNANNEFFLPPPNANAPAPAPGVPPTKSPTNSDLTVPPTQPKTNNPTAAQNNDAQRIAFLTNNAGSLNNANIVSLENPLVVPFNRRRSAEEGCREMNVRFPGQQTFICVDLARNVRCLNGAVQVNAVNPFSGTNLLKACVGGFCGGGLSPNGNPCVATAAQAVNQNNQNFEFFVAPSGTPGVAPPTKAPTFAATAAPTFAADQANRIDFISTLQQFGNRANIVPLNAPLVVPTTRTRTAAAGCAEMQTKFGNGETFICTDLLRFIRCQNGQVIVNQFQPFDANNKLSTCFNGGFCRGGTSTINACQESASVAVDQALGNAEYFLAPP